MTASSTAVVSDARPPLAVVHALSRMLRVILATPLGRLLPGIAMLQFTGRRTGRRYRVVVGWYDRAACPTVVTPAPWRANFAGPGALDTIVRQGGRTRRMRVTLNADPAAVADRVNAILAGGRLPGTSACACRGATASRPPTSPRSSGRSSRSSELGNRWGFHGCDRSQ